MNLAQWIAVTLVAVAVEVSDPRFSHRPEAHVEEARASSREVRLEEVDSRTLPTRARDALAWLFTPYL